MIEKQVDGISFLEFSSFKNTNWFKHCFSTRIGGVSTGPMASMNLAFRDDLESNVRENYKRLCSAAGFTYTGITFSAQEHGTNIKRIYRGDKGKGYHIESDFDDIDGIITDEKGIVLTTFYADCTPVYLADTQNKAIGLLHAGWRGTVNKIAEKAIDEMNRQFGTEPENVIAAVGPSICYKCFEVDRPVYDEFREKLDFSHKYCGPDPDKDNKYIIDLKNINKQILINAGVPEQNIEVAPECTKCDERLFFSHRRSGYDRGSMIAMMEII